MGDDAPVPFGHDMSWLAIRSADNQAVVRALGLTDPRPATWARGIETVYDSRPRSLLRRLVSRSRVFVTPAVDGWVLVVGGWGVSDLHAVERAVAAFSARFGEAQAFATFRAIEYHHWIVARDGALRRSFAYVGQAGRILADSGDLTPAECSFDWDSLAARPAQEGPPGADVESAGQGWAPGEEDVMRVAGEWSVDPARLGPATVTTGVGLLAKVPGRLR